MYFVYLLTHKKGCKKPFPLKNSVLKIDMSSYVVLLRRTMMDGSTHFFSL